MKPAQITQSIIAPTSWDDLPYGENYRRAIESCLRPWWPKLFGFHLLKIGTLSAELNTESCAISHQVNVGETGAMMHVLADPYQLPFANKSTDACLLAHTLSYTADPHRLLREVDRVLIDDGWLIITTFNPVSLLGLGKLCPVIQRRQPYRSRMYTQMRLLDWLSVLNYEVQHRSWAQVLPWRRRGGCLLSEHVPAVGCLSVIVARKRTFPLARNTARNRSLPASLRRTVGAASRSG
ncbi:class I SAM-dependent methyltransferase [Martelella alba]|uniref:Class I SAM-dependent methyltransferase n=1 Tax=Martelella alba TaxID=2590451 RepID=A0ABY2SEQ3_9HYPH|nr:class I SAM-dependent methyltransferase [Martelella alba]TKI03308.1 class I SAM-dependent methyltransferase [Martelella alba]